MPVGGAAPSSSTVTVSADGTLQPTVTCACTPSAMHRKVVGASNATTSGAPSGVVTTGATVDGTVGCSGMVPPGAPGAIVPPGDEVAGAVVAPDPDVDGSPVH